MAKAILHCVTVLKLQMYIENQKFVQSLLHFIVYPLIFSLFFVQVQITLLSAIIPSVLVLCKVVIHCPTHPLKGKKAIIPGLLLLSSSTPWGRTKSLPLRVISDPILIVPVVQVVGITIQQDVLQVS